MRDKQSTVVKRQISFKADEINSFINLNSLNSVSNCGLGWAFLIFNFALTIHHLITRQ